MKPVSTEDREADKRLVEDVLARQPGAFEELVSRYQRLCWHIIDRMVKHPEDTRELCQEVFLRIYRHLHQYRGDSPLKSWIGRAAYNIALRHLERNRIAVFTETLEDEYGGIAESVWDEFDPETACSCARLNASLHEEIEALPPLQRMLLTLYHLEEMSITEIAAITDMKEGTIRSHLFRSRVVLKKRLSKLFGER